jgi:hypothetical protein
MLKSNNRGFPALLPCFTNLNLKGFFEHKTHLIWVRGLTQQRASVRPCAVGALLRLDFLVLLGQTKRTKRKRTTKCLKGEGHTLNI